MKVLSLLPFPPLLWWKEATHLPLCLLDAREHLGKMGRRNRYRLASSNGPLWLTIPIIGGREQRASVSDILIDNRLPWQRNHWRSLESIYRRTPFFEHYAPSLQTLFRTPFSSVADFNLQSIEWCRKALRFSTAFEAAGSFPSDGEDRRERRLSFEDFPTKSYAQPFEERTGFLRGMSVLDALFCNGPAAVDWLL